MPKAEEVFKRELKNWIELKKAQTENKTWQRYRNICLRVLDGLKGRNMNVNPTLIGWTDRKNKIVNSEEIKEIFKTLNSSEWQIKTFRQFLEYSGNPIFKLLNLKWSKSETMVRWMTVEQIDAAFQVTWFQPDLVMCLAFGFLEMMRRHEWMTIKTKDIEVWHQNRRKIRVHGKGRMGGKTRYVDIHPEFMRIYEHYLKYRDLVIRKAKPNTPIPEEILIYEKGRKLYSYSSPTSMDNKIKKIEDLVKSAGIDIDLASHMLRRTSADLMDSAEIDIEYIQVMMGHAKKSTTEVYLQKMKNAKENQMHIVSSYLKTQIEGKKILSQMR